MTAAPEPQQPDEVRKDMPLPREAVVIAAELAVVEKLSRPAAPSAQPDECDRCGLPRSTPLHGNPFGAGHLFTPAQPVRDSKEK